MDGEVAVSDFNWRLESEVRAAFGTVATELAILVLFCRSVDGKYVNCVNLALFTTGSLKNIAYRVVFFESSSVVMAY